MARLTISLPNFEVDMEIFSLISTCLERQDLLIMYCAMEWRRTTITPFFVKDEMGFVTDIDSVVKEMLYPTLQKNGTMYTMYRKLSAILANRTLI